MTKGNGNSRVATHPMNNCRGDHITISPLNPIVYHTFWQDLAFPALLDEAGPPAGKISAAKSFASKQVAGSPPAILDIRAGLGSQRRFVMRDIFWQSRAVGP